jgi:hypothetical protein
MTAVEGISSAESSKNNEQPLKAAHFYIYKVLNRVIK